MPFPFDATMKDLADVGPVDFVATFDAPPKDPVRTLNVDLSTVTTAADLVFGIGDPLREVVHIDCQVGPSADLHRDVLAYNALLFRRTGVPVHSVVLLLRPQARHRNLTGSVRYQPRPGRGKMDFEFELIPLWELPAEVILAGGPGTLPLAPLCRLPEGMSVEEGLAVVIGRMVERLQREAAPELFRRLVTASFMLTGLRVDPAVGRELFRGVPGMRESTTYQAILDEGREEQMRKTLFRQGQKKFGPPSEPVTAALNAIHRPGATGAHG
jgi:hypothetical protein